MTSRQPFGSGREVVHLEHHDDTGGRRQCFFAASEGDAGIAHPVLDPSILVAELELQPQCRFVEGMELGGPLGHHEHVLQALWRFH